MSGADACGRLAEDPFDYRITKRGEVRISRGGRVVATVAASGAARLIATLHRGDARTAQLALARATGNYRRGNERR